MLQVYQYIKGIFQFTIHLLHRQPSYIVTAEGVDVVANVTFYVNLTFSFNLLFIDLLCL